MGTEERLPHFHSGKVRDTKWIPRHQDLLLPIATDRISTHNVKHKTPIPGKGELLTALTIFWALKLMQGTPNHLVEWGRKIYGYLPSGDYDPRFHYRAIVVRKMDMIPVEFVWRNFLTGSLFQCYQGGEDPYGLRLPQGLTQMARFSEPKFTPTDKSETDEPLRALDVTQKHFNAVRATSDFFDRMAAYLAERGITLVDAKFEVSATFRLADEWGTGDCCRMAWTKDIRSGEEPPWLDKEVARQIAKEKWAGGERVPLEFTPEEVKRILDRYHEAFEGITGASLADFQKTYMS